MFGLLWVIQNYILGFDIPDKIAISNSVNSNYNYNINHICPHWL